MADIWKRTHYFENGQELLTNRRTRPTLINTDPRISGLGPGQGVENFVKKAQILKIWAFILPLNLTWSDISLPINPRKLLKGSRYFFEVTYRA